MKKEMIVFISLVFSPFFLWGCSFNPFISRHHETGSPAGVMVGAVVGAGSVGLLGAPKSLIVLAGLGGGAIGYYVTTLRFDSGGIMHSGGQVYQIGEYLGLYIPTDNLFEPNTAVFLPQATPVLESVMTVLKRKPNNNILIIGNTSGFTNSVREYKLSRERAQQIFFYLSNANIVGGIQKTNIHIRQVRYVGYGDSFPIASHLTNDGIREISRIQIISYPSKASLYPDKQYSAFDNIASFK